MPASDLENFKVVIDEEDSIVEAVSIEDKTENKLEFSKIVSVLANVTANLRELLNDFDSPSTIEIAKSSLSDGEALVEILRSDLHPPLFIEPGPTESVIIAWVPDIHDLVTEIDPPGYDGKVVAYVRPESVKADDFPGLPFTINVNGKDHMLRDTLATTTLSYESIVELVRKDRVGHDKNIFFIEYQGITKRGTLRPGEVIIAEPGMIFNAISKGDA